MSLWSSRRALRQYEMLAEGQPLPKRPKPEPGPAKLAARLAQAEKAGGEWADGNPGQRPMFYPAGPPVRFSAGQKGNRMKTAGIAIRVRPKQPKPGKVGPIGRRG